MSSAIYDHPSSLPDTLRPVRALFFDLLGTTLAWVEPLVETLESYAARTPALASKPPIDWASFAQTWDKAHGALIRNKPSPSGGPLWGQEDAYLLALEQACEKFGIAGVWEEEELRGINKAWEKLGIWPDTKAGIELLKTKYTCVGLTNGSAAFMAHLHKRNDVSYDLLLTSDMVGAYKPDPRVYANALALIQLRPEECAMVASHAYDLEAAGKHGMRKIYIHRETEDVGLDLSQFTFDLSIGEGGLVELARRLGIEPYK